MTPAELKAKFISYFAEIKSYVDTAVSDLNTSLVSAISGKVDKAVGKSLTANDFTDTLKSKLDNIQANANNYSHATGLGADSGNLTGPAVISNVTFNSEGHLTSLSVRNITYSDIGAASAGHHHNADYSAINHNHNADYAALNHNHNSVYVAKLQPAGNAWITNVNNDGDTGLYYNSAKDSLEFIKNGAVKFRFNLTTGDFSNVGEFKVGELIN